LVPFIAPIVSLVNTTLIIFLKNIAIPVGKNIVGGIRILGVGASIIARTIIVITS
jgi:hypothetical protein